MSCIINWSINVERGSYDDDNHFETQIRFNEGDSSALEARVGRLLEYLIEEGVMDHENSIEDDYEDDYIEDDDTEYEYDDDVEEDYDSDEDS
tara:strand:+ start:514 stop:789 length:276 start_codon:yes stop_codon:yes gene_type:complete